MQAVTTQEANIQNESAINNSHINEYIRRDEFKENGFFLTLPDIWEGDMFKPNFSSIEYEISREIANDPVLEDVRENTGYNGDSDYAHFDFPSPKILEIANLHKHTPEYQKEVHDTLKAFYKENVPVGNDTYTSGGTHFHIFVQSPYMLKLLYNTSVQYWKKVQEFLLNTPLYAKPYHIGNQLYLVNRYNRLFKEITANNPIKWSSKGECITLKKSYWGTTTESSFDDSHNDINREDFTKHCQRSIEFRLNNVVDERIAGYYIASLLYPFTINELGSVRKIQNKKDIFSGSFLKTPSSQKYVQQKPEDDGKFELDESTIYDRHISELIDHEPEKFKISRKDKLNIAYNIGLMEEILKIYQKPKALEMIRSYISDHNII